MTKWEYSVEEFSMAEKWNPKRQAEELAKFGERLNTMGAQGWEMISYETVPLYGSFSSQLKGSIYLLFFKRPAA